MFYEPRATLKAFAEEWTLMFRRNVQWLKSYKKTYFLIPPCNADKLQNQSPSGTGVGVGAGGSDTPAASSVFTKRSARGGKRNVKGAVRPCIRAGKHLQTLRHDDSLWSSLA